MEIGLSDAGLLVPRTADYLQSIRDDYEAATGLTVDWDADLILGQLSAIAAQKLGEQAEVVQAVYDAFGIDTATGVQLSAIARLVGVVRARATKALVTVTATGTPGTALAIGRLVEGGGADGHARWTLIEDALIGAGGTVDVLAEAELAGRTVALAGEVDAIVTAVPGWISVTNAEAASPGTDDETDTALRIRRLQSIQRGAGLNGRAMRARILALPYVTACTVIDNPDNEDGLVQGIAMLAHSYLPIILPDTLTGDQEDEILEVIESSTPVSTRHSATDVTGIVIGASGFGKEVGFDYATEVQANIVANLTMLAGYSISDAGVTLRALVEDYIGTLQIGDELYQLRLVALASTIPGVIGASFLINGVENLTVTAVEAITVGTWAVS